MSLQDLLTDDGACVLTFVSPGCGPCATLLPELARWYATVTDGGCLFIDEHIGQGVLTRERLGLHGLEVDPSRATSQ